MDVTALRDHAVDILRATVKDMGAAQTDTQQRDKSEGAESAGADSQRLEDASQGKPVWCPAKYDGAGALKCEMETGGELKALVSGTTSVVGLAGVAVPGDGPRTGCGLPRRPGQPGHGRLHP